MLDWGREFIREPDAADAREWLCTNGLGGFAAGTVSGRLARRYHGLLIAALAPPLGRTLLVAKTEDVATYAGQAFALSADRWADGTLAPRGDHAIERFRLDGTVPVWTYACAEARLERAVWMEHGANTTYVRYRLVRGAAPLELAVRVLVNYRDYHALTQAGTWRMTVEPVTHGVRVTAFAAAQPFLVLARDAAVTAAHVWYHGVRLPREAERGLESLEDHLHAATVIAHIAPSEALTVVLSAETAPDLDSVTAWRRQGEHEEAVVGAWRRAAPAPTSEPLKRRLGRTASAPTAEPLKRRLGRTASAPTAQPAWLDRLVLAADQFIVRRGADGLSVIAGYPWFGDWGRDTMLSLPGLTLTTGRSELAQRILTTFARVVDRGMLPNRFPDSGEAPEYNTVDAALWFIEAVRAYDATTKDDTTLAGLLPALEAIVRGYREGTRYGIREDPADHLLFAGEPGVQLTWMDAKVGDRVITPRTGKAVEVNALWYNAFCAMRGFAERLGRPTAPWGSLAEGVRTSFDRFWNDATGCCFDVLDGPEGDDPSIRPNQLLAVSLPASPLAPARQRQLVDACARRLAISYGVRSLAPNDPRYCGRYLGDQEARDGAYHQGTAWAWLLGPFALAHFRVYGDREAALALLAPIAHHLADAGLGSISEIFDGEAPHVPRGCPQQAWSVAEVLRAWVQITGTKSPGG